MNTNLPGLYVGVSEGVYVCMYITTYILTMILLVFVIIKFSFYILLASSSLRAGQKRKKKSGQDDQEVKRKRKNGRDDQEVHKKGATNHLDAKCIYSFTQLFKCH